MPREYHALPKDVEACVLLLTRKDGETITVGDEISVTALAVHGPQVKLGIEAPVDVVQRLEIAERASAANHGEGQGSEGRLG